MSSRSSAVVTAGLELENLPEHSQSTTKSHLPGTYQNNQEIIKELRDAHAAYLAMPQDDLRQGLMGKQLDESLLGKVDDIVTLLENQWVDVGMAKVVNQIFLTM